MWGKIRQGDERRKEPDEQTYHNSGHWLEQARTWKFDQKFSGQSFEKDELSKDKQDISW